MKYFAIKVCRQLFRGVIGRSNGGGGYVVLNAQDYAEV